MTARLILAASLGLALSTSAFAQSYTAPAGIAAVTAPGGLEGRSAAPNLLQARERAVGAGPSYDARDDVLTGSLRRPDAPRTSYGR